MRVEPNDMIAGVRARDLRDYFRRLRGRAFVAHDLIEELGVSEGEATQIVQVLQAQGLIEPEPNPFDDRSWFNLTTNGNQLALAKFTKRFSRETAEALLHDAIARAKAINADDDLVYRVSELRVFGSFLTDAADLGDLDLAYELEVRRPGEDIVEASLVRAKVAGAAVRSFLAQITYGETEVVRLLRGKSPRLSLHRKDELKRLGVNGKVVYPMT